MSNGIKNGSSSRFVQRFLRETIDFVLVFLGVFLVGMIALNHKIFMIEIQDMLYGVSSDSPVITHTTQQFNPGQTERVAGVNIDVESGEDGPTHSFYEYHLNDYLASKIRTYNLPFNTYIPGKRIVIDAIGVDAPIVDVSAATDEKIQKGDFDEELTRGVVKYPFTSNPGEKGSALVFGHSSIDSRGSQNDYGYVFYKLPKLADGDMITLFWNGQLHEYEVDKKVIKWPSDVSEEVASYNDEHYLTLMACYPLMSDAKRILVRAKEIKKKTDLLAKK